MFRKTHERKLVAGLCIEPPVPFPSVLAGILGTANGTEAFCSPFLERERHAWNCLKGNCSGFWGDEDGPSVPNPEFPERKQRMVVPGRNWVIYNSTPFLIKELLFKLWMPRYYTWPGLCLYFFTQKIKWLRGVNTKQMCTHQLFWLMVKQLCHLTLSLS